MSGKKIKTILSLFFIIYSLSFFIFGSQERINSWIIDLEELIKKKYHEKKINNDTYIYYYSYMLSIGQYNKVLIFFKNSNNYNLKFSIFYEFFGSVKIPKPLMYEFIKNIFQTKNELSLSYLDDIITTFANINEFKYRKSSIFLYNKILRKIKLLPDIKLYTKFKYYSQLYGLIVTKKNNFDSNNLLKHIMTLYKKISKSSNHEDIIKASLILSGFLKEKIKVSEMEIEEFRRTALSKLDLIDKKSKKLIIRSKLELAESYILSLKRTDAEKLFFSALNECFPRETEKIKEDKITELLSYCLSRLEYFNEDILKQINVNKIISSLEKINKKFTNKKILAELNKLKILFFLKKKDFDKVLYYANKIKNKTTRSNLLIKILEAKIKNGTSIDFDFIYKNLGSEYHRFEFKYLQGMYYIKKGKYLKGRNILSSLFKEYLTYRSRSSSIVIGGKMDFFNIINVFLEKKDLPLLINLKTFIGNSCKSQNKNKYDNWNNYIVDLISFGLLKLYIENNNLNMAKHELNYIYDFNLRASSSLLLSEYYLKKKQFMEAELILKKFYKFLENFTKVLDWNFFDYKSVHYLF